jgi:integrase
MVAILSGMACLRPRRGFIVLDYRDGGGHRKWRQFPDTKQGRADAEIALGEVQRAARSGSRTDDTVTAREVASAWLQIAKRTVRPGTYAQYECDVARFLEDFGARPIVSIRTPMLIEFGMRCLDAGLAPSTVATHVGAIRLVFEHAIRSGYLVRNPCSGLGRVLKLRRKDTGDIKAMTEEQLAVFLQAADTLPPRDRLVLYFYPLTGLRISEGLGLRVEDFDAEACRFRVEYQRLEDRQLYPLKTRASRRSVDVAVPLRDLIVEDLARRREEAMAAGRPAPEFIIEPAAHPHQTIRRAMAQAVERAKLPAHLTVHCLRHSFATLHLLRGAALLWVSRQLGHSSVNITADTYAAWMQPESPGTADAFAERIAQVSARVRLPSVGAVVVPFAKG